jgi:drug/metabolite transporter (DMT)-like permease
LILYRNGATDGDASITGDLVVLAGVIACSIGYIAGGKLSPVIGTWATTFWGIALAAAILAPVGAILLDRTNWAAVDSISWFAMGYLAFLGTTGCYLAWFWALGRGGITRISSWQLAQPVITLIFAAILLGELITLPLIVVAGVIVAGAAYTQLPVKRS